MPKGAANLVRATVLAPYVRILQAKPKVLRAVFHEAEIPKSAVNDRAVWLPKTQVYRFAAIAARLTKQPHFGALAGLQVRWAELGVFGMALRRAANLEDAGERARLSLRFSATGADCWVESMRNVAWFCYRPEVRFEEGADQAELYDLGLLLQFVRFALGPNWTPERIQVACCRPDVVTQVKEFSLANVSRHNDTTAIGFPKRLLQKGVEWERSDIDDQWIEKDAPDGTVSDSVRRMIRTLLPYRQPPELSRVADMMRVNPRTLQRMLISEGTTFRQIVDSVRRQAALDLLETTNAPLKLIAKHLGYSSAANFVRAFRNSTGKTPAQVRAKT